MSWRLSAPKTSNRFELVHKYEVWAARLAVLPRAATIPDLAHSLHWRDASLATGLSPKMSITKSFCIRMHGLSSLAMEIVPRLHAERRRDLCGVICVAR
jgi:hypothetical protein